MRQRPSLGPAADGPGRGGARPPAGDPPGQDETLQWLQALVQPVNLPLQPLPGCSARLAGCRLSARSGGQQRSAPRSNKSFWTVRSNSFLEVRRMACDQAEDGVQFVHLAVGRDPRPALEHPAPVAEAGFAARRRISCKSGKGRPSGSSRTIGKRSRRVTCAWYPDADRPAACGESGEPRQRGVEFPSSGQSAPTDTSGKQGVSRPGGTAGAAVPVGYREGHT